MTTDSYTKDKRAATAWVFGIVAVLLTSGLGFLGTQLMAHETSLAVVKEKQQKYDEGQKEMRDDIKEILRRMPKL